jgi:hypothetical protein
MERSVSIHDEPDVRRRPFGETDLQILERFATDPDFSQPFDWSGYSSSQASRQR